VNNAEILTGIDREIARVFHALPAFDVENANYTALISHLHALCLLRELYTEDKSSEVPDAPPEAPGDEPDAAADENGEPTTTYTQEEVRAALFEAKTKNDIDTGALIHKYAKNLKVLDEKFYGALMADLQTALEAK
jgi:hypothetical protein